MTLLTTPQHHTTSRPIGVAFSGLGAHMVTHARNLSTTCKATIIGAFDPSQAARENFKRAVACCAREYASYDALLADASVDAVMIGSPDEFHLAQLEKAVKAGKHALVEKPMCVEPEQIAQLKTILAQAKEAGLAITSCHPRRFDPPYVWLKTHLPQLMRDYGKPMELKFDLAYEKIEAGQPLKHGGRMLLDHISHENDSMRFLFGNTPYTAFKLHDEADRYHVVGVREDELSFSFSGTRRIQSREHIETITLRLERATVHIDTKNPRFCTLRHHEKPHEDYQPFDPGQTNYDLRLGAVNKDWIDSLSQGRQGYLSQETMIDNAVISVAFNEQATVRYIPAQLG